MKNIIENIFIQHGFNVSRETILKFEIYEQSLRKWQKTINLIGPSTLDNIAERHFLDSAQLITQIPDINMILSDMGSGAGFPGMVLAILGMPHIHLIESDVRKVTFLQNVSRETFSPVTIHNSRVEDCKIPGVEIVTARALAPLEKLLGHMSHLAPNGTGLFLKGAQHPEEIDAARKTWHFSYNITPSITDPAAGILKISGLKAKA